MTSFTDPVKLAELQAFVEYCQEDPAALQHPKLAFFKDFLTEWGATIPSEGKKKPEPKPESPKAAPAPEEEDPPKAAPDLPEPEYEEELPLPSFDEEEDPQAMPAEDDEMPAAAPDGEKELTDAEFDAQMALKQSATDAMEDGDLATALAKYTEVLKIGNPSALLYVRRAEVLLKLKRPNACIRDCTLAMDINPDSGKAYKVRGKAYRCTRNWKEAHSDLAMGQQIDFDDATADVQAYVDERFKQIDKVLRENQRIRERNDRERKIYEAKKRKAA